MISLARAAVSSGTSAGFSEGAGFADGDFFAALDAVFFADFVGAFDSDFVRLGVFRIFVIEIYADSGCSLEEGH